MTLIDRVFARAHENLRKRVRQVEEVADTPISALDAEPLKDPVAQDRVYTDEIIRLREEEELVDAGFTDGWEAGRRQRKPGTKRKDPVDLYQ